MISKASLISFRNLDLAWSRITTAKNLQHKRMFRHLYNAYEPGRKANLQLLHEKLKGGWRLISNGFVMYSSAGAKSCSRRRAATRGYRCSSNYSPRRL